MKLIKHDNNKYRINSFILMMSYPLINARVNEKDQRRAELEEALNKYESASKGN